MKVPFQYDVFLSHNQADKTRVRWMAERLRAAGGHAQALWFDERKVPVAASQQSAAFSPGRQGTRQQKDGGALPRRRYTSSGAGAQHQWRGNLPFGDPANTRRVSKTPIAPQSATR